MDEPAPTIAESLAWTFREWKVCLLGWNVTRRVFGFFCLQDILGNWVCYETDGVFRLWLAKEFSVAEGWTKEKLLAVLSDPAKAKDFLEKEQKGWGSESRPPPSFTFGGAFVDHGLAFRPFESANVQRFVEWVRSGRVPCDKLRVAFPLDQQSEAASGQWVDKTVQIGEGADAPTINESGQGPEEN